MTSAPKAPPEHELRRRIMYLMLFRVVLISLVMGSTALLYWVSDADLGAPEALWVFAIIGFTYLLTIVYAVWLQSGGDLRRLGYTQLAIDLVIASLLIHVTGGAQSAYTFFFPLAIIGAATIGYRRAAIAAAIAAAALFLLVSVAGWFALLPLVPGRMTPASLSPLDLTRLLGLNLAAITGVAFLAINLGGQLERASATLATQQTAAEDLRILHEDIVRCLSSGLITVDSAHRVLTINQAACDILGASQEGAVGSALNAIVPGLRAVIANLAPGESLFRSELSVPRRDKPSLVLGISVSPLADHANRPLGRVINFQDLTEMRELERTAQRAERLAVIGRLAAGVAHEIRNPLASISGSVELLSAATPADDESRALAEIVHREVGRLNTLISELLDFANPRQLARVELDIAELVRETLQVFNQDRELSAVKLASQIQPEEKFMVVGDPEKLRQVLWNLLRNAAEATGGVGKVNATVAGHADGGVEIAVSDTGPGIPPENLERVFDPFFTTKQRGSGLGLATVHAIVTGHGGSIRVASEPGKGATFIVRLPYTAPEEA